MARILGSHPDTYMIPIEVRFIVDDDGLCDLVAGKCDFDAFAERMLGQWWHRTPRDGESRGLHKIVERDVIVDAVDVLSRATPEDLLEGSHRFIHQIFDPIAEGAGARTWVEMTPPNVARGEELCHLIPEMKLVHSVRDGKDVACSVAVMNWGPEDPIAALEWWGDRMAEAHYACAELGSDRLLTIRLEDLIVHSREPTLRSLLDFAGLEPHPNVDRFFQRHVDMEHSHIGRWVTDINADTRDEFLDRYELVLARLTHIGVDVGVASVP